MCLKGEHNYCWTCFWPLLNTNSYSQPMLAVPYTLSVYLSGQRWVLAGVDGCCLVNAESAVGYYDKNCLSSVISPSRT